MDCPTTFCHFSKKQSFLLFFYFFVILCIERIFFLSILDNLFSVKGFDMRKIFSSLTLLCIFQYSSFADPTITYSTDFQVESSSSNEVDSDKWTKNRGDELELDNKREVEKIGNTLNVDNSGTAESSRAFEKVDEKAVLSEVSVFDYSNDSDIQALKAEIKDIFDNINDSNKFRHALSRIFLKPAFLNALIKVIYEDDQLWGRILKNNLEESLLLIDYVRIAVDNMYRMLGIGDKNFDKYTDGFIDRLRMYERICGNLFFGLFCVNNKLILFKFRESRTIYCFWGLLEALSRSQHTYTLADSVTNRDDEGMTVLHRILLNHSKGARMEYTFALVELILKIDRRPFRDSVVNIKDSKGNTALILAVKLGLPRIAVLLIANGADVDETNDKGKTALDYLGFCSKLSKNEREVLKYLLGDEAMTGSQVKLADAKEKARNWKKGVSKKAEDTKKKIKFLKKLISNPSKTAGEAIDHILSNSDLILNQMRS